MPDNLSLTSLHKSDLILTIREQTGWVGGGQRKGDGAGRLEGKGREGKWEGKREKGLTGGEDSASFRSSCIFSFFFFIVFFFSPGLTSDTPRLESVSHAWHTRARARFQAAAVPPR